MVGIENMTKSAVIKIEPIDCPCKENVAPESAQNSQSSSPAPLSSQSLSPTPQDLQSLSATPVALLFKEEDVGLQSPLKRTSISQKTCSKWPMLDSTPKTGLRRTPLENIKVLHKRAKKSRTEAKRSRPNDEADDDIDDSVEDNMKGQHGPEVAKAVNLDQVESSMHIQEIDRETGIELPHQSFVKLWIASKNIETSLGSYGARSGCKITDVSGQ